MTRPFKKDPNSELDYTVLWEDFLTPVSDTIASVTWILSAGLTEISSSHTDTTATIWLSGGVVDEIETAICRITTNSTPPRIEDKTVEFLIVQK